MAKKYPFQGKETKAEEGAEAKRMAKKPPAKVMMKRKAARGR